jgi:hypothetical protein
MVSKLETWFQSWRPGITNFMHLYHFIDKSYDYRKKNNDILYSEKDRYPGYPVENAPIFASIYLKKQIKTPLYPNSFISKNGKQKSIRKKFPENQALLKKRSRKARSNSKPKVV